jgi:hypothetical protein
MRVSIMGRKDLGSGVTRLLEIGGWAENPQLQVSFSCGVGAYL